MSWTELGGDALTYHRERAAEKDGHADDTEPVNDPLTAILAGVTDLSDRLGKLEALLEEYRPLLDRAKARTESSWAGKFGRPKGD